MNFHDDFSNLLLGLGLLYMELLLMAVDGQSLERVYHAPAIKKVRYSTMKPRPTA